MGLFESTYLHIVVVITLQKFSPIVFPMLQFISINSIIVLLHENRTVYHQLPSTFIAATQQSFIFLKIIYLRTYRVFLYIFTNCPLTCLCNLIQITRH